MTSLRNDRPAKFMVGGYDTKTYAKGPIKWHNANEDESSWSVNFTGVSFGGEPLEFGFNAGLLPDTGTSFTSLPSSTYDAFMDLLNTKYGLTNTASWSNPHTIYDCTQ